MTFEDHNRNAGMQRFQSIMHLGMGGIYIIFGLLVVYVKYFGTMELSAGVAYTLGGFMVLYGVFRIWRGITSIRHKSRQR